MKKYILATLLLIPFTASSQNERASHTIGDNYKAGGYSIGGSASYDNLLPKGATESKINVSPRFNYYLKEGLALVGGFNYSNHSYDYGVETKFSSLGLYGGASYAFSYEANATTGITQSAEIDLNLHNFLNSVETTNASLVLIPWYRLNNYFNESLSLYLTVSPIKFNLVGQDVNFIDMHLSTNIGFTYHIPNLKKQWF